MSVSIVYDRKFIKTSRGIIPLVLTGSSNCTEFVFTKNGALRERLERYWSFFWGDETLELPEEELIAYVSRRCEAPEEREMFRLLSRGGKVVTTETCVNWYRNGVKAASSIENLLLANHSVSFNCYLHVYQKDESGSNNSRELSSFIYTTKQLEQWLDKARARKKELKSDKQSVYICLKFSENNPLRAANFPEGPVLVKQNRANGGYLRAYESNRTLHFSPEPSDAVVFDSAEEAYALLGRGWNITFVRAALKNKAPLRYALRFEAGRFTGKYVYSTNGGYLKATPFRDCAKQFRTPYEARKCGQRVYERFSAYDGLLAIVDTETDTIMCLDKLTKSTCKNQSNHV